MAQFDDLRDDTLPSFNRGISLITKQLTLPATGINSGDNVEVFTVPHSGQVWRLSAASLGVSGTLGASVTAQLKVNRGGTRTVLTPASTAAAAGKVTSVAQATVPFDLEGGDVIEIAIAGGNVSVSADLTVDLEYALAD